MPESKKDNELFIGIEVGDDGLKKGLKQAEKDVASFGDEAESVAKKTEEIGKASDKNTKSLKKLTGSLGDVGNGLENVTRSSGDLGDKLRGVGQITSGVSTSLAGVGSAAAIATGAILAVGAAIGVALYFYGKHRAEAFDLELQYKKLNDRIKEYEKSLWGVDSVLLKGTQGAAANIASLQSLRAQVEDTTLSQKERERALDAIRKKYPSYFTDLSDEKILLGKVGTAYDDLTTDIIQNARARAGIEALTANLKKEFALEEQLLKKSLEISTNTYKLKTISINDYARTQQGTRGFYAAVIALEQQERELLIDHKQISKDIVSIQGEGTRLAKIISDNGGILPLDSKVEGEAEDILKIVKEVSKYSNAFKPDSFGLKLGSGNEDEGFLDNLLDPTEFLENINVYKKGFQIMSDSLEEWETDLPDELPFPKVNIEELTEQQEIIKWYLDGIKNMLDTFGVDAAELIVGSIADTFTELGRVIGESLAMGENVVEAMGASLLSSMGKFLGELGQMLIVYGTYAIMMGVLSTIASTPGPQGIIAGAAAIGVGIAMVAISSAIGARQAAGPGGSGSTVGVSGGGSTPNSYSGSSVSSSSSGGGGTYVFEIEGTKLVGVLSNTLSRNRALGGSLGIT